MSDELSGNKETMKPELDTCDLAANEKLLAARAYILFTVKDNKGDMSFHYSAQKLNDLEIVGFLRAAINELEKIVDKAEYMNGFGDNDDDAEMPEICKNCKNPECDDCDLLDDDDD